MADIRFNKASLVELTKVDTGGETTMVYTFVAIQRIVLRAVVPSIYRTRGVEGGHPGVMQEGRSADCYGRHHRRDWGLRPLSLTACLRRQLACGFPTSLATCNLTRLGLARPVSEFRRKVF